jgi:hypothetical protein
MPSTIRLNTIASSTPTVTTMRACRSLAVYLCRVMESLCIGQARCKLVRVRLVFDCLRVLFRKPSTRSVLPN